MHDFHPFFLQYEVRQHPDDQAERPGQVGFATIIVFADNQEQARARAGRMIAEQGLGIRKFSRIHLIDQNRLDMLNSILASLYQKAEMFGIAFHLDFLPHSSRCCSSGT